MLGKFSALLTFILLLVAGCQSPIDKITDKFGPPTRIVGSADRTRIDIFERNRASARIDVHTYKVKGFTQKIKYSPAPFPLTRLIHDPTQCECSLCMYANQAR